MAQLVDFKLKVGTELAEKELEKYRHASTFGKVYQRTLEWVLMRPRSVKETHDYLKRLKETITALDMDNIINILAGKGYLDDAKFAEYYVENRFAKKGISKKRLSMELVKKGINKSIVETVLAGDKRNDEIEIQKIIAKKRARYDDKKLMNYLARQGFSYDLIRNALGREENENSWD